MPFSSSAGALFLGTTISPTREFIADRVDPKLHDRVILPCVGRWAVATAVAAQHGAHRIHASDLSLFSSVIGYLADPRHTLEKLEVHVPDGLQRFVRDAGDEIEHAAGILMAVKFLSSPAKSAYDQEIRNEFWRNSSGHRDHIAAGLREQVDLLAGCRYDVRDLRDVARELQEDDDEQGERTFLYVNPPGYAGGYTKMYGAAEAALWRPSLEIGEFHPDEVSGLLQSLNQVPALVLSYVHHGDDDMPDGWVKLMAHGPKTGRVDYIVANRDPDGVRLSVGPRRDATPKQWPVFSDDHELRPDSVIEFVKVDKHTALHYRDLFVHRLGQSTAQWYALMLIDGRVTTAFGLLPRALVQGRPYLSEVFGISVTSERYSRLGKLFMLALTSGDFKKWAKTAWPAVLLNYDPKGIETASPTLHHEGKTDRGVLRLVRRLEQPDGTFQLLYEGDFRTDTFAQVMADWHSKFGRHQRPTYDGPGKVDPSTLNQTTSKRRGRRRGQPNEETP